MLPLGPGRDGDRKVAAPSPAGTAIAAATAVVPPPASASPQPALAMTLRQPPPRPWGKGESWWAWPQSPALAHDAGGTRAAFASNQIGYGTRW